MARPQRITDDTIMEALAAAGEATSEDLAARLGIGQSTAAKRLAALEGAGMAQRQPGGRVKAVRAPDRWTVTAAAEDAATTEVADSADSAVSALGTGSEAPSASDAAAAAGDGSSPGDARLGPGALGALVREYLAARPSEDLGPTQVGKALGRSQGAVANALARLEAAGDVQLVSTSPRRYRLTTETK